MLFTVIIPTYNRAHIICETIESVLNQTYSDFEIIIIDNFSTDNTIEILEKYKSDKRIRLIVSDKNYERSRSRNVGIEFAKGNFLSFLDSDDLMGPDCLKDAHEYILKHKNVKIFHNKYLFCDQNKKIIKTYQDKINYELPFNSILKGNFLACIGVFICQDIYKNFLFLEDKAIIGSEDWLFWIQIIAHSRQIGHIDKVNSYIVQHSGRTENNRNPFEFEKQINLLQEIVSKSISLNKTEKKIFDFSTSFLIASDYCDAKEKKIAFKIVKRILKKNPSLIFNIKILNLIKNLILR